MIGPCKFFTQSKVERQKRREKKGPHSTHYRKLPTHLWGGGVHSQKFWGNVSLHTVCRSQSCIEWINLLWILECTVINSTDKNIPGIYIHSLMEVFSSIKMCIHKRCDLNPRIKNLQLKQIFISMDARAWYNLLKNLLGIHLHSLMHVYS